MVLLNAMLHTNTCLPLLPSLGLDVLQLWHPLSLWPGVQVLIRRDLEEAAKVLGERIRTGSESSEVRLSDVPRVV